MFETCTDYYSVLKELRIFAEGNGHSIHWLPPGKTPRADNKGNIYIPKPDPSWNSDELITWKMFVYHEISHQLPGVVDAFDILHKHNIDMSSGEVLPAVLNYFEDYRTERHKLGDFAGRDYVLSKGREIFDTKIIDMLKTKDISQFDKKSLIFATLMAADTAMRATWQRDLIGQDTVLRNLLPPEQQGWVDQIVAHKAEFDALGTSSADATWDLTNKIMEEVFKLDPEEEKQKAQSKGKAREGNEGEESGEEGKEGEGKTKGKGEGKGKEAKRDQAAQVRYEDMSPHHHDQDGPTYTPLEITYSNTRMGGVFTPTTNMQVYDFTNGPGTKSESRYAEMVSRVKHSNGLSNKVRKLLQVKSQSITIYGQKSGKVAGKSIHRVTMEGSGEYQNKIFKKKINNNILDTAVTILADFSGSMGGDKQVHSICSALMLNDTLARIGVPVEIIGFTERTDAIHYIFKTHKKRVSSEQLLADMSNASGHCMGGNADGESILYAYDRLRQQKNKRKLLIVLSDGQPASDRQGDINQLTKEVIKSIEKKRDVEIYGVGIMSNSVKRLYKHSTVIKHAGELEAALLTVISGFILN